MKRILFPLSNRISPFPRGNDIHKVGMQMFQLDNSINDGTIKRSERLEGQYWQIEEVQVKFDR